MALTYACEVLAEVADLSCECDLPDDADVLTQVLEGASDFLSQLAGYPLGRCTNAWRPCRDDWCAFESVCACCGLPGIHLPGINPVVGEVWIDGVELDASEYQVMIAPYGKRVLVRLSSTTTNGLGRWPSCRSTWKPRTADGTFEIVVESGVAISQLMRFAAAEIACDAFKFIVGAETLLPAGVVSAVAYGVAMNTRLPFDPTRTNKSLDLTGFTWVPKFLNSLPTTNGTEVISPELDDGWSLWQVLEPVAP